MTNLFIHFGLFIEGKHISEIEVKTNHSNPRYVLQYNKIKSDIVNLRASVIDQLREDISSFEYNYVDNMISYLFGHIDITVDFLKNSYDPVITIDFHMTRKITFVSDDLGRFWSISGRKYYSTPELENFLIMEALDYQLNHLLPV